MKKSVLLIFFLFVIPCVFAYDLNVTIIADENFTYGSSNLYKFLVKNNETASEYINFSFYHNITDLDGNLLKFYTGNYQLKIQKTISYYWTPSFQVTEIDNVTEVIVCGKIVSSTANDFNQENDFDCKQIKVLGGYEELETDDTDAVINIEKIYSKYKSYLQFGEIFLVKLEINRNEIDKYSVYAYVVSKDNKRVSEETIFYVPSDNETFTFKIPIALKPNCKNKYYNGTYYLIIEGLGEKEKQEIEIFGNVLESCETTEQIITKIIDNTQNTTCEPDSEVNCTAEKVFSSDSLTSIEIAKYLFMFVLLVITAEVILLKK